MNKALIHRGPDAGGSYEFSMGGVSAAMGNRRLKIIDCQDRSNQPFFSSCGRFALVYNGEIYNFKALRQQLQAKGIAFQTDSDTEVLMVLLQEQGIDALVQLEGMFAFCWYDSLQDSFLIARDRSGIKPLYYAKQAEQWVISSELRGIFASGLVPKILNETQIPHFLQFKFAQKPETFFKHVYELPEGHYLSLSPENFEIDTYIPSPSPLEIPVTSFYERIEEGLIDSVRKHLVADVGVGLFLSGGVDSTLLLALLRELGHEKFPTFSIVNEDSEQRFGDGRWTLCPAGCSYLSIRTPRMEG